jgi:hypothetical protein
MTHVASLNFQGEKQKSLEILYNVMPRSRGCVMTLGVEGMDAPGDRHKERGESEGTEAEGERYGARDRGVTKFGHI